MSAATGPVVQAWRTDTFRRLTERLDRVLGDKTAKQFEPLKVRTVRDLMHHLPRRYFSAAELSDLSVLQPEQEVAVVAEVVESRAHNMPSGSYHTAKKPRLEARITDHRGSLTLTFFGQPRVITYWQNQLTPGCPGDLRGQGPRVQQPAAAGPPGLRHRRRRRRHDRRCAAQRRHDDRGVLAADRALPADGEAAHLDDRGVRAAGAGDPRRPRGPAARLAAGGGGGHRAAAGAAGAAPARQTATRSTRAATGCASTRPSPCS